MNDDKPEELSVESNRPDAAPRTSSDHLRALFDSGAPLTFKERRQLESEARLYKWADQLSLAELKALVARLQSIIDKTEGKS